MIITTLSLQHDTRRLILCIHLPLHLRDLHLPLLDLLLYLLFKDNDDLPSISPVLLATLKKHHHPHPPLPQSSSSSSSTTVNTVGLKRRDSGGSGGGVDSHDRRASVTSTSPSYQATADALIRMYSAAAVMPAHLHTPLLGRLINRSINRWID